MYKLGTLLLRKRYNLLKSTEFTFVFRLQDNIHCINLLLKRSIHIAAFLLQLDEMANQRDFAES